MNNSVWFTGGDLLGSGKTDQGLSISAVTTLPDDTLLLAGSTGLYRLKGNELVQEVAFIPPETTDSRSKAVPDSWTPTNILVLDDHSYVLGTANGEGVYLLRKGSDGQWSFLPVDDTERASPIIW
jgi:hypothetical protein